MENLEHETDFFFDDDLFSHNRGRCKCRKTILCKILSILPSKYSVTAKLEHSDGTHIVTEIFFDDVSFRLGLLHKMPDFACMLHETISYDSNDGIDRISDMPDAILCKILSCLSTKDAVAAKILSTGWKALFPFIWVPPVVIDIDDSVFWYWYDCHHPLLPQLHNFVDQLLHETIPRLDILNVTCRFSNDGENKITSWVRAALQLNVRELFISTISSVFHSENMFSILNGNKALTCLKLSIRDMHFDVNTLHDFLLPNLKTLVLSYIDVREHNSLNNLVKGCPVLEVLSLSRCSSVVSLSIRCPLLKNLTIKDWNEWDSGRSVSIQCPLLNNLFISYNGWRSGSLQIDAPKLEVLICNDHYDAYTVSDFESLITADISVRLTATGQKELVTACSSVTHLTLSTYTIDALSSSAELPMFKKLKQLSLGHIGYNRWDILARLLCNAPNLQKVTFKEGCHCSGSYDEYSRFESLVANHPPICLDRHLKEIEFLIFRGSKDELKLVQYFLGNGRVIQTLLHCTSPGNSKLIIQFS